MEDLFHAVAPFGSMYANALLERCNEWGIHPADVVEYAQDNFEYSPKADDIAYNINELFLSLFYIRISKLSGICREATEYLENYHIHKESYYCKDGIRSYLQSLEKLQKFLDDEASEHIHINAMCSCFDNEVLSDLDGVLSSEDLLEWLEKNGELDF